MKVLFFALFLSAPFFLTGHVTHAQSSVPAEYREEIRDVLLSGKISAEVNDAQFEAFVDALSDKAYKANVTGQDLTEARVEALLGAAAITGFDAAQDGLRQPQPNAGFLWLIVLLLIVGGFITWRWRRMHDGGALGHI